VPVAIGTAETLAALEAGRVDLAGAVPPADWPYRAEPLYDVWIAVVGIDPPGVVDVADLAGRPLALLTPAFQSRLLVEDVFRRRGLRPVVAIESESPEILLAAAQAKLATAVMVSDSLPMGFREPVGELRDRGRPMGGTLSLVWRDDETLSTAARQLKDEALAYAEEVRSGRGPAAVPRPALAGAPTRRPPAAHGRSRRARSAGPPAS
jgi:hypothetical protein